MRLANHHSLTKCEFGNQAHEGDFHHTGFTEVTLKATCSLGLLHSFFG